MAMAAHGSLGSGLGLTLLAAALACAEQLPVKTYTMADGLGRDHVACIVQDPRGFLWFCAGDWLSRFDGYAFINYGIKQGLPNRWVTGIQITPQGVYWVGTVNGLLRRDPNAPPPQRFESVPVGANEDGQYINALVQDHSG